MEQDIFSKKRIWLVIPNETFVDGDVFGGGIHRQPKDNPSSPFKAIEDVKDPVFSRMNSNGTKIGVLAIKRIKPISKEIATCFVYLSLGQMEALEASIPLLEFVPDVDGATHWLLETPYNEKSRKACLVAYRRDKPQGGSSLSIEALNAIAIGAKSALK